MSERDPQIDFGIKLYALYGTPSKVFRQLKDEFGDNALTYNAVTKIRSNYRKEIIEKRAELTAQIPILSVEERWMYLQDIMDTALEGDSSTFRGVTTFKIDRKSAIECLKIANDMTAKSGIVPSEEDEDMIRGIVRGLFEDLKSDKPNKSDNEILDEILESLGTKVSPHIAEIKQEIEYERQDSSSESKA